MRYGMTRLVAGMAIAMLMLAAVAQGRTVHYFDCKNCHRSGVSYTDLGNATTNICLRCHKDNPQSWPLNDATPANAADNPQAVPTGLFADTDASNALKSYPHGLSGGQQTSHLWAAGDTNAAAGASAPVNRRFYGRYGITAGKVACSRCHDPHGRVDADNPDNTDPYANNPQLLKLGAGTADLMCLDCHRSWAVDNTDHALGTHPMVADYNSAILGAQNAGKYQALYNAATGAALYNVATGVLGANVDRGAVRLLSDATGSLAVSCTSCHGVHFSDSDSATADGKGRPLNPGDGKLLRSDGPRPPGSQIADYTYNAAVLRSGLCRACHAYKPHGDSHDGPLLGCLDCHGGHSHNGGDQFFYVLRKSAFNPLYNSLATFGGYEDAGIRYAYNALVAVEPESTWKLWNDGRDGEAGGYCETCHGDAAQIGYGAGNYHVKNAVCTDCHRHERQGADFSFEGSGCDGCHALVPQWNSHPVHMNPALLPAALECATCHKSSEHLNGLSEVRFDPENDWVSGGSYSDVDESSRYNVASGYGSSPAYGSCATLYCHSNGAPFDGAEVYRNPTWGDTSLTCASCHDSGGGATSLSGRHGKHTDGATYDYDCSRCHAATAADSGAIVDTTRHVNRAKDVVFAPYNTVTGSYNSASMGCQSTYCHSDGRGGAPNTPVAWSDTASLSCASCHNGRIGDASQMASNAHLRLANEAWIRQYPCASCHFDTVDGAGSLKGFTNHVNGKMDIAFDPKWSILGKPAPSYNAATMVCDNIYCHSDGTTVNPEVRDFPWNLGEHADCDTCHGHDRSDDCGRCHTGEVPSWSPEEQWKRAMPMYANTGPGTERANSHLRHLETEFSCENCHVRTVVGSCGDCHTGGVPAGKMTEVGHVYANYHVNGVKDVVFGKRVFDAQTGEYVVQLAQGSYDPVTKRCSNTECHTGADPQWGESRNDEILCLTCHGTTEPDTTDYDAFNGLRGRINMTEWFTSGHGRKAESGAYPSGNPPADFPGNPCWYCHDNEVLHRDADNPLRLKAHPQFEKRFEKECVYCHMEGTNEECLGCHNSVESLSKQLTAITGSAYSVDHALFADGNTSCLTALCHPDDASRHNSGAGTGWDKEDIKNQYVMTGVCLQCHDNDDNGRCHQCHTWNGAPENDPYRLGFDPGTGFKSGSSKASSTHFGYKHYEDYEASLSVTLDTGVVGEVIDGGKELKDSSKNWTLGQWRYRALELTSGANSGEIRPIENSDYNAVTLRRTFSGPIEAGATYRVVGTKWKGGKFCWDCHDPHGDTNIYMIQDQVSTETDGTFGIPLAREPVVLTKAQSGLDFAKNSAPYNGICNVCHQDADHYQKDYGDGHRSGRVCTSCHEHGFGEGHASGQACDSCHQNKPISTHTGFGQPRDCTKCHEGAIMKRMDIMRQFRSPSHHVQGVEVDNRHCYACHWEATEEGLIDVEHHAGYNYKTRETVSNAKTDLALWGAGARPTNFEPGVTSVSFNTVAIGTAEERSEIAKVSEHCLSCHSDQNNETEPFGDCKTPAQYAWDRGSIASRYSQTGTTIWGKYATKNIQKALSAHGNAVVNEGGWSAATGEDDILPNTRAGSENVQCFDCHSSHGSFTSGVSSSYATFDGSFNGGNLKETQAGKGGYGTTYRAQAVSTGFSLINAGAAQCFDCHETADAVAGNKPWGYQSTYGASSPIMGYRDSSRFDSLNTGFVNRLDYRKNSANLRWSGHMTSASAGTFQGLCSACHDPHGVSRTLGANQEFGVPLLKGTWMTSPFREDRPNTSTGHDSRYDDTVKNNRHLNTNPAGSGTLSQGADQFAGLCLRCHPKETLTIEGTASWKSKDRVHQAVKGWGANHVYTCSKCHVPHVSNLPKLMGTNCMDGKHRNNVVSGGSPSRYKGSKGSGGFPAKSYTNTCHASETGIWSNQYWNNVTPW